MLYLLYELIQNTEAGRVLNFLRYPTFRIIAAGVFVQALLFVPMILVHAAGSLRAEILLVIVCAYWVCGLIVGPRSARRLSEKSWLTEPVKMGSATKSPRRRFEAPRKRA